MGKSTNVNVSKAPANAKGVAAPTKDGYKFTAKWSKPDTSKTNAARAEKQIYQWRKCVWSKGSKKEKKPKEFAHRYRKLTKQKEIGTGTTSCSVTLKRDHYYPRSYTTGTGAKQKTHQGKKLHKVMFRIKNKNSKGTSPDWVTKEYAFEKPEQPKIEFEYDNVSELTITVTSENTGKKERWDCVTSGTRKDKGDTGADRNYQKTNGAAIILENGTTMSNETFSGSTTSKTYKHRVTNPNMPAGTSMTFTVTSTARGFWGDTSNTKQYRIRPPYKPEIDAIRVMKGSTEIVAGQKQEIMNGNGQVIVEFSRKKGHDDSNETNIDDKVRTVYTLERLISEEWQDQPAWAQASGNWETSIDEYSGSTSDRIASNAKDSDTASMGENSLEVIDAMQGTIYGHHVWYRIKAFRQGMTSYSDPVEAKAFYIPTPSAANDKSGFVQIANGSDGTTIETVVGWDDPNDSDEMYDDPEYRAKGEWVTQIGYSKYKDAINSNAQPNIVDIDWGTTGSYGNYTDINTDPDKIIPWNETAECAIHDLVCGQDYYLWCRRHVEMDGLKERNKNSHWIPAPTGYFPFKPIDNPSSVTMNVQSIFVPLETNTLSVSWMHNATAPQKDWVVYALALPDDYSSKTADPLDPTATSAVYLLAESIPRVILKSGSGSTDHADITYEELRSAITRASVIVNNTTYRYGDLTSGSRLFIGVGVSTGGKMTLSYSNLVGSFIGCGVVQVAERPDCAIYVAPTLTAQPVTVYTFTNYPLVALNLVAMSNGASISYPDGDLDQAYGDYVWSESFGSDIWQPIASLPSGIAAPSNFAYFAALTPGEIVDFYQNGVYRFEVQTVNEVTIASQYNSSQVKLVSDISQASINVNYTREPNAPGATSRCETRNSNSARPYVEIYCAPPANFDDTGDRANVYRVTPDGATLIAGEVRFGTIVTDEFPPFSKVAFTRYAITTITSDGQTATREVPYSLRRHGLRFDWGDNRYVELPYDIELSDSFDKDSDIREHQDGTVTAHWNPAINRTMTSKTKLIKDVRLYSVEEFELVREMAHYPGPVLVRAHNGIDFLADVSVNDITDSYDSLVTPISITCREITMMDQFMAHDYQRYNQATMVDPED